MKIKQKEGKFLTFMIIGMFAIGCVNAQGAVNSVYEPLIDDVALHIRFNQPAAASPLALSATGDTIIRDLDVLQNSVMLEDCEILGFDRAIGGSGTVTFSNAGTLDVVALPDLELGLATTAVGAFQTYQDHLESSNKAYNDELDAKLIVWEQDIEARTVLTSIASTYNTLLTYLNLTGVQFWMEIDYNEDACDSLLDEVLDDTDFYDLQDESTVTASDVGEIIEDYLHHYSYDFGLSLWNETLLGTTLLVDRLETWETTQTTNFTEAISYNHMLSNVISAYGHRKYSVPDTYDKMVDGNYDPSTIVGENSYFRLASDGGTILGIQIDSILESATVPIDNVLAAIFQIVPPSVANNFGWVFFAAICLFCIIIAKWKEKIFHLKTQGDWMVALIVIAIIAFIITAAFVHYTIMTW